MEAFVPKIAVEVFAHPVLPGLAGIDQLRWLVKVDALMRK